MTRKHTWQNPLSVPYPPAQITPSGRLNPISVHSLLQTFRLTIGTSTTWSTSTILPPVFVRPHPATRHFALSCNLLEGFGSWIGCTLLFSLAFLVSWRHTKASKNEKHKVTVKNQLIASLTGGGTELQRFYCKNAWFHLRLANLIFTYFEEHDVISMCRVLIRWVFATLYTKSHCVIIKLLEIVGSKNNTCGFTEWVIIERLSVDFRKLQTK